VIPLEDALGAFGVRRVSGRAVRIAIVDSGVYAAHPHVQGVAAGVSLVGGSELADYIDRNGHGTAVTAAIREKAPGAELVAVKVFDRELATTAEHLARAIEWSARERVDVINLSLGTTNPAHAERLAEALRAARDAGAAVVAAATQSGLPSLPGSLQPVIAVEVDWACPRDEVIVEAASSSAIRLRASGYPRPIPGVPPERNLRGVSFAVANASGLIARFLAKAT
jgi:subtilisin family serine protease